MTTTKKLPVTLISGFLGSGKTTLLQHILRSKDHGLRCAVIVNDMAEINIDGATVENSQVIQREEKLVQMQNGCICCTLREDLLEEINRLAAENRFDYLLIESTGISEPMQVAETFSMDFSQHVEEKHEHRQNQDGEENAKNTMQALQSLSENARLDTCVSMVDANSFHGFLNSSKFLVEQFDDAEDEDEKTVVDLLVSQIEFADVILLNKLDVCTPEKADQIEKTIRGLNPVAKILRCEYSKVNVKEILNTGMFSMTKAVTSPGWLRSMKEEIVPESIEYGISSFVYRQRRPFHPKRLYDLIKKAFLVLEDGGGERNEEPEHERKDVDDADESQLHFNHAETNDGHTGYKVKDNERSQVLSSEEETDDSDDESSDEVVKTKFTDEESDACFKQKAHSVFQSVFRSKGFLWIAGKDQFVGSWSQAGIILTIANGGPWFIENMEEMELLDEDMKKAIMKDFDKENPKNGDRRQEIVFIGDFKDEEEKQKLRSALNQCLMQENETSFDTTEDPWEEWY